MATAAAWAGPPESRLISTAPIAPATAWSYFNGLGAAATNHTTGSAAWTQTPPEIKALARSLGSERLAAGSMGQITQDEYVANVFNYVRSNIAVEYRFGLGKGARGALIDQYGTPFDQAELMVKLLRVPTNPSISASYVLGTADLNAQQFAQWTGIANDLAAQNFVVNAQIACQFMADGGVPATCSPASGALSTITFGHIWVSVNGKVYDPSFKEHSLKSGINLPAAMGCGGSACGQAVAAAGGGTLGTFSGVPYIQNFNVDGAKSTVTTRATSLKDYILENGRQWEVVDLVGGKILAPSVMTSFSTLPYGSAVQTGWLGEIPDAFRTTLKVYAPGLSAVTFFADEIAGRRLTYSGGGGATGIAATNLYMDAIAQTNSGSDFGPQSIFRLIVNHPYAAESGSYADASIDFRPTESPFFETGIYGNNPFVSHDGIGGRGGFPDTTFPDGSFLPGQQELSTYGSFPMTIVHGFGNQAASAQQFMSDLVSVSPVLAGSGCRPSTSTSTMGAPCTDSQPVAAETMGVYKTMVDRIVAGVTGTAITRHHSVGLVFSSRTPGIARVTINEAQSISSRTADAAARTRAQELEAAVLTVAEGAGASGNPVIDSDFSQMFFNPGRSIYSGQSLGSRRIFDVSPASMATWLNSLTTYAFDDWREGQLQAAANSGYSTLIVEGGDTEVFSKPDSRAYAIWENLKGAGALANPLDGAMKAAEVVDAASLRRKVYSVSEADGSLTFQAQPDIVTGVGEFPEALAFIRTYQPKVKERAWMTTTSFIDVNQQGTSITSGVAINEQVGTDNDGYARLGGGWTHNFNVTAAGSGDAAKALGSDLAVEASTAIAAAVILNDLFAAPSLQNRVAAMAALNAMSRSLYNNSIIVKKGAATEAFTRLPDGTSIAANGSSATMSCPNGAVTIGISDEYVDEILTNCTYTGVHGDVIAFSASHRKYDLQAGALGKHYANASADTWTYPNGLRLTFEYAWRDIGTSVSPISCSNGDWAGMITCLSGQFDRGRVLTRVSNNLGRSLTFTTVAKYHPPNFPYFWDNVANVPYAWMITAVTDETGRAATFGQSGSSPMETSNDVFTAQDPNGNITRYEYTADLNSPDPSVILKPNYRLRRWFTPGSGATPFAIFTYDELYRIKSVSTLVSGTERRVTTFNPGGVVGSERRKSAYAFSPSGFMTQTVFDDNNNPIWIMDPNGQVTTKTYDNLNRPLVTTLPELNSVENEYDIRGNVTRVTQVAKPESVLPDLVTTSTYAEGPTIASCTNPRTCNKVISEDGPRTDVTDVSDYTWNATTGLLTQILLPAVDDGTGTVGRPRTDATYTNQGNGVFMLTSKTDYVRSGATRVTSYTYNASNKYVLNTVRVDPSGLNLTTTLTFNARGDLLTVNGPLSGTSDTTTYHFDAGRRITRIDAPLNSTTRYTYNADGDVTSKRRARVNRSSLTDDPTPTNPSPTTLNPANWLSEINVYNAGGDLLSVTDDEANQTLYGYDFDGRQVLVTDPDGRQAATIVDPAGLTACIWRGGTVATTNWTGAYVANAASNDLNCDTWSPASYNGGGRFRYVRNFYTGNGKQASVTDANGNTTKYAYDGMDRLRFTLFPDPNAVASLCTVLDSAVPGFDSEANSPTCAPPAVAGQPGPTFEKSSYADGVNRTQLLTRRSDAIGFAYDALNRQATRSPAGQGAVTSRYNWLNEPVSVSKAAFGSAPAHTTSYTYDNAGRKLTETNDTRTMSFQYDAVGKRTRTTWPGGYYASYTYDSLGRMTDVRETASNTRLAFYSYDQLSRRNYMCLGTGTSATCSNRMSYSYEADGDLDVLTNILNTTTLTLDYGRNRSHQITSITASNDFYLPKPAPFNDAYTPNALNQYSNVDSQASTYDASGNLLTWYPSTGKASYAYDSENRLTSAAVNGGTTPTIFYDYDALGRRFSKTVDNVTTQYLLDGDEEVAEYNGSVALRRYVMGPAVDDRVVHIELVGVNSYKTYYHTNHQGSVIAMTDAIGRVSGCSAGVICQQLAYDEYGRLTTPDSGEVFRYTGRRFDAETKLYYYRARYYVPDLGRFLQVDPIGYKDDLNLYAYVANDPLTLTDPTGESARCPKVCQDVRNREIQRLVKLLIDRITAKRKERPVASSPDPNTRQTPGPKTGDEAAGGVPERVYRGATQGNANHVARREGEAALSFRDSLSNPVPSPGSAPQPVFRPGRNYIEVDTSRLPPGSVVPDGGTVVGGQLMPPGHVSVYATPEQILNATINGGKFKK